MAMDNAASRGHLEVIKWLHSNRLEGCTTDAMDEAASRGNLEVVKWLHFNRTEGCTTMAMDKAICRIDEYRNNDAAKIVYGEKLRIMVKYFIENRLVTDRNSLNVAIISAVDRGLHEIALCIRGMLDAEYLRETVEFVSF